MKKAVVLSCLVLFGCASPQALIEAPDVSTIYAYVDKLRSLSGAQIVDGADLVTAAYYVVDDRCQKFFDQLEANKAQLLFAQNATTDATSLAVQILTQLTIAQRDIGIVAASGKFASDTIKNYNTIYYFAPYSGQLHKLVGQAQADYKQSLQSAVIALAGPEHPVSDAKVFFTAANIAQGYGRTCTYSQFELFVETALGKANATNSPELKRGDPRVAEVPPGALSGEQDSTGEPAIYLPPYVAE